MTPTELATLAMDVHHGKVFGSWNIHQSDFVGSLSIIFMPIALGLELPEGTAHVYEYLDKASPRGVNGYPTFFSCRTLDQQSWKTVYTAVMKLRDSEKVVLDAMVDNA